MSEPTEKQKRFADEYLIDLNAKQAAIRSGYSAKTAEVQGSRLLSNAKVQAYIAQKQKIIQETTNVTIEWVIGELVDTYEHCRQKIAVLDHEGNETGEWRFEPASAVRTLELLGKHLGMFKEKIEVGGNEGKPINIEVNDVKSRLIEKFIRISTKGKVGRSTS